MLIQFQYIFIRWYQQSEISAQILIQNIIQYSIFPSTTFFNQSTLFLNMNHLTKIIAASFFTFSASCLNNQNPPPFLETLQYRANNPIEDRLCYGKINKIPAYLVSVFDGHGGYLTADFAAGNLLNFLNNRVSQNLKTGLPDEAIIQKSLSEAYDDLENSFLTIFKQNISNEKMFSIYRRVGACALSAVILKNSIHVANAGDCEGVILGTGNPVKINERLNAGEPSEQQRLKRQFPDQPDIYKCIKNTNYCYVKGRLQPTRSLGDFYLKYKQYNFTKLSTFTGPYITHKPLMTSFKLQENHKSLVLASDGLWDELDENEMNNVAGEKKEGLAQGLFDAALVKINERNKTTLEELEKIENRRDLHDDISIITVNLEELKKTL